MPIFVAIGYGDRKGYDRTPVAIRDAAHAHDAQLRKDRVLMGTRVPRCKCAIPMLLRFKRRTARS